MNIHTIKKNLIKELDKIYQDYIKELSWREDRKELAEEYSSKELQVLQEARSHGVSLFFNGQKGGWQVA